MRLALLVLFCLLSGCALQPFRTHQARGVPCDLSEPRTTDSVDEMVWERSGTKCAKSWAVRFKGFERQGGKGWHGVNYVEIDEQGMVRDRRAVEDALRFAAQDPARSEGPRKTPKQVYVVVYIHGWHHNASPDDSNVQAFHTALAAASRWNEDREVRGVYVGWRGESVGIPGLNYLTFWDRKSTSEEVGRGGLLEFLLRLEMAVKKRSERDRLILVGHSFGASVAFNSLAHVFLQRFMDGVHAKDGAPKSRFKGYGDLVVLINPAIEAMRYMPFHSAIRYYAQTANDRPKADFANEKVPRLLVLSSEGDWATRIAFPAARTVSTMLEAHEVISPDLSPDRERGTHDEGAMDRHTVGNYEGFHTHNRLEFAEEPSSDRTEALSRCENLSEDQVKRLLFSTAADKPPHGPAFPDSNLRLLWSGVMPKFMPYILASVDRKVIKDHTAIGHPALACFISQLADGN
jgi:hypothetical protein